MCGIVGALSLNNSSINIDYTKPMADKIAHNNLFNSEDIFNSCYKFFNILLYLGKD